MLDRRHRRRVRQRERERERELLPSFIFPHEVTSISGKGRHDTNDAYQCGGHFPRSECDACEGSLMNYSGSSSVSQRTQFAGLQTKAEFIHSSLALARLDLH